MIKKLCCFAIKLSQKQSGFSLVEVIVAIFLTGIMVIVIANIPQAIKLTTSSQAESKVREVAAKKLSDIRLTGYDNLPVGVTSFSDSRLNDLAQVNASMTVVDCPLTLCPGGEPVKQVTISFDWHENDSDRNFQLDTLIGKGGLK